MQKVWTLLFLAAFAPLLRAQDGKTASFWKDIAAADLPNGMERTIEPLRFRSMQLDLSAMQAFCNRPLWKKPDPCTGFRS